MDPKTAIPRHVIIKLPKIKDKERILKAAREKESVTYKGVPISLSADFSKEPLLARRSWKEVFKVMKGKDLHPRLLYQQSYHLEWKGRSSASQIRSSSRSSSSPSPYYMKC